MVYLPVFTGIFSIVNIWSGSTALPQAGDGSTGVRVLWKIDSSPPASAQQWNITYVPRQDAYLIQNVATGTFASSVQNSAAYYGNPTVEMNTSPDYWTLQEGADSGTYRIIASNGNAWQAYTGDTNGAIILNAGTSDSTFQWMLGAILS